MHNEERPDHWQNTFSQFLEGVYRSYYPGVVVQVKSIVKDIVKAEEITARKFRTMYDRCEKGKLYFHRKEAAIYYWLRSARKEAYKKRTAFRLVGVNEEDLEDHATEDERILAIIGSHTDFKKEMHELLQELPAPDQEIVTLFLFENMSHKEIAARLGLGDAATRKRYSRALAKLNAQLDRVPGKKARLKDYLPVLLALLTAMPDQQ